MEQRSEETLSDSPSLDWKAPRTVKITDFGLAKILDHVGDETRSGAIIGTPAYMAPEQAKADLGQIGPQSDVYALGAILYELITGRQPFQARSDAETLRLVVSEDPCSPRQWKPQCPRDLEAICLKCLEKSPTKRYRSAGELGADLRRFLTGEPTMARPLSTVGQTFRWASRNRRVAALLVTVAGLLLCITIGSVVAAMQISRARDEAEKIAERERLANIETALARDEAEKIAVRERQANKETARALLAEKESLVKAIEAERVADKERQAAQSQAAKAGQVSRIPG